MTDQETIITNGIKWWLGAELQDSKNGKNKVWDDYAVRDSYVQPLAQNADAIKTGNHFGRFRLLLPEYTQEYANDKFVGRLIHHTLMFVSGKFRTECLLRAADQTQYENLRFDSAHYGYKGTSCNIGMIVRDCLASPPFDPTDLQQVAVSSQIINQQLYNLHHEIYGWLIAHPDSQHKALEEADLPVANVVKAQELAVRLAVGHVILAAQLRGDDVGRVPVLEPMSITDASVTYPFSPQFDLAQI